MCAQGQGLVHSHSVKLAWFTLSQISLIGSSAH
jgi:hypothetical protein